ncbi:MULTISPECIES: hypothetical protein [unclassified Nocardia]|uniref:hypothetical protein n=1 Tax=unclassified Nocardia TaxID=2637762 RepID=UPI001CE4A191|nr:MULTISPECIES: hypothetical protein [unclassified Nocardia]
MNQPEPMDPPSLADRVNMLFRTIHGVEDDEPTTDFVAEALRANGVDVSVHLLGAIRAGTAPHPPATVLIALAAHFRQPSWYLTEDSDAVRVMAMHVQLGLLRVLRDSGVSRVKLRGKPASSDRAALTRELSTRDFRTIRTPGEKASDATHPAST